MFFKKREKLNIVAESILLAVGVLVYVLLVAEILYFGNQVFGKAPSILGAATFLLLFVFSAIVVGSLVLGRSIYLYLTNNKHDAIRLFLYIVGWLFIIIILIMIGLLVGNYL